MTATTRAAIGIMMMIVANALASGMAAAADEKDYSYLFPRPMPGWTAGSVASEVIKAVPVLGDTLKLSRSYTNARNKGGVIVIININNCLLSGYIEALRRRGETSADNVQVRPYEFAGYKGIEIGPEGSHDNIELIVKYCNIVSVDSAKATPREVTLYLDAIDFKAIETFRDDRFSPQLWP
jgi:hypothetical protein